MKLLAISVLALICSFAVAEKARYDNYRVYQIAIENEEQVELMKQIENYPNGYNFWEYAPEIGAQAELVVPPHKFGEFSELIEKFELKTKMTISNLQEVIDNEQPRKQPKNVGWTAYYSYADVSAWLDTIAAQNPASVTPINYGSSFEGRALKGIKINIGGGNKKAVVFEGTMHAREWISTATTTWLINEILTSSNAEIQEMARTYEWYIFPITNPDGYAYTWERDRNWRKTRKPTNALCTGVDANRNWDDHWMQGGASSNPCSDTFAGPSPFSETETKSLSDYIATIPRLTLYLSFHAYGQMLMTPYGWTNSLPPDYDVLHAVAIKGADAIRALYNTNYRTGSISNVIYIASGSSADWAHGSLNVPLAYAYEFRDEGRYGFSLPADQIIPNSQEILASVNAMLKEARARGIA